MLALPFLALLGPEATSAELVRFPSAIVAESAYHFASAHMDWLQAEIALHPGRWADFQDWLGEAGRAQEAWRLLHYAHWYHGMGWSSECQHSYLADLRLLLGDDAFGAGRMPSPAPFWRFVEIDR